MKRLEEDDAKAATAIAVSEVTKVRVYFDGMNVKVKFIFPTMLWQSPEAAEYTRQIKEKLKEAEYLGT